MRKHTLSIHGHSTSQVERIYHFCSTLPCLHDANVVNKRPLSIKETKIIKVSSEAVNTAKVVSRSGFKIKPEDFHQGVNLPELGSAVVYRQPDIVANVDAKSMEFLEISKQSYTQCTSFTDMKSVIMCKTIVILVILQAWQLLFLCLSNDPHRVQHL